MWGEVLLDQVEKDCVVKHIVAQSCMISNVCICNSTGMSSRGLECCLHDVLNLQCVMFTWLSLQL